ncbi:MAG: putative N-acetylmannosamine-6-phosphate 2-epimerase [Cellvibrionales bacterium]|nr:putative N-acetylmannosamine-6-phosphate 2-epimerase [Cellvibrionales bacterium]
MPRLTIDQLDAQIKGGLIASCQPVTAGPLDTSEIVAALSQACLAGGARALRIEGAKRVQKVRQNTQAPIIGIVKRDLPTSPVRITPLLADVRDLAAAGADIIAFDCTDRPRPTPRPAIIQAIHTAGCIAMADCATLPDIEFAHANGAELIATTLSGYTGEKTPAEPDYDLLKAATKIAPRIIAEGRFNTPTRAQKAMQHGAWAVTVGTALTRIELITKSFADTLHHKNPN